VRRRERERDDGDPEEGEAREMASVEAGSEQVHDG
jgi:hypothetical protein